MYIEAIYFVYAYIRQPLPSVERVRTNNQQRATIKLATSGSYERRATSDERRPSPEVRLLGSSVRGCSFVFSKGDLLGTKTRFQTGK